MNDYQNEFKREGFSYKGVDFHPIFEVEDGNCFFYCLKRQLCLQTTIEEIRKKCGNYIKKNKSKIKCLLDLWDVAIEEHCIGLENSAWATQMDIIIASLVFEVEIFVLSLHPNSILCASSVIKKLNIGFKNEIFSKPAIYVYHHLASNPFYRPIFNSEYDHYLTLTIKNATQNQDTQISTAIKIRSIITQITHKNIKLIENVSITKTTKNKTKEKKKNEKQKNNLSKNNKKLNIIKKLSSTSTNSSSEKKNEKQKMEKKLLWQAVLFQYIDQLNLESDDVIDDNFIQFLNKYDLVKKSNSLMSEDMYIIVFMVLKKIFLKTKNFLHG